MRKGDRATAGSGRFIIVVKSEVLNVYRADFRRIVEQKLEFFACFDRSKKVVEFPILVAPDVDFRRCVECVIVAVKDFDQTFYSAVPSSVIPQLAHPAAAHHDSVVQRFPCDLKTDYV